MANSFIQLPADGAGKKLDTEQLTVGANTVERQRDRIAGAGADDLAVVTDGDPSASDHGVVTREAGPLDPQTSHTTSVGVAAGGSADLDSANISPSKTGKLLEVTASASVPIKMTVKKVAEGVETVIATRFGWLGVATYRPPHKSFVTVAHDAGAGFDGFRVTIENKDTNQAADVYADFAWDEA